MVKKNVGILDFGLFKVKSLWFSAGVEASWVLGDNKGIFQCFAFRFLTTFFRTTNPAQNQ